MHILRGLVASFAILFLCSSCFAEESLESLKAKKSDLYDRMFFLQEETRKTIEAINVIAGQIVNAAKPPAAPAKE